MKVVKRTALEVLILGAIAVVAALTANGVRAKGSLKLTRNYFHRIDPAALKASREAAQAKKAATRHAPSTSVTGQSSTVDKRSGAERSARSSAADSGETADGPREPHPDHGFQEVSFEQVVEIFNDPNTEMGASVFVDARSDDAYEEGHIPGAIQANHYEIEKYIDDVLAMTEGAERVVVYCNGGDCEDSILVCGDLLEAGLSYDSVYLFAGGWTEWTAHNMPVATGRFEHGSDE